MLLNELFSDYIEFYELILRKHTLESDISTYKKHIASSLGEKDVNNINFLDIQRLCNNLIKADYKIKTVKNILAKLHVIFKFAQKLFYRCRPDIIQNTVLLQNFAADIER